MLASWRLYTLKFKRPAGTSRGTLRSKSTYFLRLARRSAPEIPGWGECSPVPRLSLDDRPELAATLDAVCHQLNRGAAVADLDLSDWPGVAFALETALLDLANGGRQQFFDTAFTRGEAALPIHGLIWMDQPPGLLQQVDAKIREGFRVIKMKVGALDFETECQVLAEIRRRYPAGDVELRLDANGAFTPENALDRLNRLAQYDIRFLEQPIKPGQWEILADLCRRSPIPIALDEELISQRTEAGRRALLDRVRPGHIVLKPTLLGGLAAAESWISLAKERGIGWWINSALESNVGLNVLAQWTSAQGDGRVHGLGTGRLFTNNIPGPIHLDGPGLRMDVTIRWNFEACAHGSTTAGPAS